MLKNQHGNGVLLDVGGYKERLINGKNEHTDPTVNIIIFRTLV